IIALSPGQADGIRKVLTPADSVVRKDSIGERTADSVERTADSVERTADSKKLNAKRCTLNAKKTEEKPITVIPNSCDIDLFRPDIDGSAIRQKRGWGDKLVLLHTGAMGKVNGLDFVIEAAERLKEHSDIMFVLIGDGNQKPSLENRVKKLALTNVEILSSVPKRELPEFYAAANMGLVIIGNFPIIEHNSANKFFDSLSAGKPVLLNYSGWQREILEENAAGFGCDLCNLDQFVEKVLHLNSHRKQIEQMGQNARRVAVEKFNRDQLAKQALELTSSVIRYG
ncbi:MAG: glycosyltransferase family 4 protein, partial [Planctomycetota bacterium]